jgi:hypothetical protein
MEDIVKSNWLLGKIDAIKSWTFLGHTLDIRKNQADSINPREYSHNNLDMKTVYNKISPMSFHSGSRLH